MKRILYSSLLFLALFTFVSLFYLGFHNPSFTGYLIGLGEAPQGYAAPYDIFDHNKQLIRLTPQELSSGMYNITIQYYHPGAYIYYQGYYLKNNEWVPLYFNQGSEWIKDQASTTLSINPGEIANGKFYFLGYSCKRYDGEWKCGCNSEHDCWHWFIQEVDLPKSDQLLTLSVTPQHPHQGDLINAVVTLHNLQDFHAFQFDLSYDANLLSFEGMNLLPPSPDTSLIFDGKEGTDYLCIPYDDQQPGSVKHIGCMYTGTKVQSIQSGELIALQFKAKSAGKGSITLDHVQISTWDTIHMVQSSPQLLDLQPLRSIITIS